MPTGSCSGSPVHHLPFPRRAENIPLPTIADARGCQLPCVHLSFFFSFSLDPIAPIVSPNLGKSLVSRSLVSRYLACLSTSRESRAIRGAMA